MMQHLSRRTWIGTLVMVVALVASKAAQASCVAPLESGRWRNLDEQSGIAYIDVKMVRCDESGTDVSNRPSYSMRCWTRRSEGKFYGRAPVDADYKVWQGKRWLVGKVYTGGYQDHVWVRYATRGGQPHLRVLIKHKSLDSKPDAYSEFWFAR